MGFSGRVDGEGAAPVNILVLLLRVPKPVSRTPSESSRQSPRLPRRRAAKGPDGSIRHQALQLLEEVIDED
jgi:hypothetical protein